MEKLERTNREKERDLERNAGDKRKKVRVRNKASLGVLRVSEYLDGQRILGSSELNLWILFGHFIFAQ